MRGSVNPAAMTPREKSKMAELAVTLPLAPDIQLEHGGSSLMFLGDTGVAKVANGRKDCNARLSLEAHCGFAAPATVGAVANGPELRIAAIEPGKWLILGGKPAINRLVSTLETALAGKSGIVTNLSHGRAVFYMSGPHARDALASLCPLDFRPGRFRVGSCARSELGETGAYFELLTEEPQFVIAVDQTMAAYAWELLSEALQFATPEAS